MGNNDAVRDLREALDSAVDPLRRLAAWVLAGRELLLDAAGTTVPRGTDPERRIPRDPQPMDPVRAAFLLDLLHDAANLSGYGMILATGLAALAPVTVLDAAQLTGLTAVHQDLRGFAVGDIGLPPEAAGSTSGKRLFRSTDDYLQTRLRMGFAESKHLLDGAALLLPRPTPGGPALPARFPYLARTLAGGDADPRAVVEAARRVRSIEPTLARESDPESRVKEFQRAADTALRTLPPRPAKKVMDELEAAVVEEREPNTAELRARQGLFYRGRVRGLSHFDAYCDARQTESLLNLFDLVDNPNLGRKNTRTPFSGAARTGPGQVPAHGQAPTPAGAGVAAPDWAVAPGTAMEDRPRSDPRLENGIDPFGELLACDPAERTMEQRHLDALTDACRTLGHGTGSTGEPESGSGDPSLRSRARLVVHVDYEALFGKLRSSGRTAHGARISPQTIRTMACMAEIVPAVMGGAGEILDYGRSRRLFSGSQLRAMAARDGGCVWPGCPVSAARTEGHHLDPWSGGGETNIGKAALFCDHHHHLIHVGAGRLICLGGVPYVIPTPAEDPTQRPVRNLYWHPELLDSPYSPTLPGLEANRAGTVGAAPGPAHPCGGDPPG
ncbi:HNH endonuclease signature motif containing protein [Paeniglutamicibacter cryotolerans]|uniref:DUF222 domain-containing protein n=1 Tax=Paeniglutamicibacter cryotolerans TaxID=670079 RepID=A0A839QLF5_9MICC|nr:HNH endonuclease signature motif containing protein [Paeniglutamicibacter cryotolerans]MBB2996443.1 hypothetical protein [Paeniglutamicibacter cryotolerans]